MNYKNHVAAFLLFLSAISHLSLVAKERADYIVIGGGTAGATIANMLSDDKTTSVLVLHNGRNLTRNPDIKFSRNVLPTVLATLSGYPFSITGKSLPQPAVDFNQSIWVMGLPLGGTSSVNTGVWARGTNQIFSQWEAIAGPEWSTTNIENLYKSLENFQGTTPDPSTRGVGGPLTIRQVPTPTPFSVKFTNAILTALGVPVVVDYNDSNTPIGATSQLQYTQKGVNGALRVSSAKAFLNDSVMTPRGRGVDGRKLRVRLRTTALRTLWEGNKAIGVEYFQDGEIRRAYANKGVIVCAGLFSSAFLMHSGVGPSEVLEPLGIRVVYDNPNVGEALADQTMLGVVWATNPEDTPVSSSDFVRTIEALLNNIVANTRITTSLANASQELLNTLLVHGFEFPENSIFSQIAWLPAPGSPGSNVRQVRISSVNPIPGLALSLVDLVQPLSRGRIIIKSSNPFVSPVIVSNIFSNSNDLNLYVQVFQTYIKQLNAALQLIDSNYKLILPAPEVLDDVNLLTAYIKEGVISSQAWQSHCRMAPLSQGGVVDSTGRVHGVHHLFVADDSIVPVAIDGAPMASAYLIAANIARMLLQE